MFRQWSAIVVMVLLGAVAVAHAQQQVPPPIDPRMFKQTPKDTAQAPNIEDLTAEERETLRRIAGESTVSWQEFLTAWSTPRPFPREGVLFIDDKYAYPHVAVSIKMLILHDKSDEETVWLKGIPPEDPESPLNAMWEDRQAAQIFYKMQRDWEEEHGDNEYFLEFGAEVIPPPFADSIELEPAFAGLPSVGLWQMSFVVADMNEDGLDDLVFPPVRKGAALPSVLLGQKGGGYKLWRTMRWIGKVPFDYGGIAVADFDADGHLDFVIGIHFKGQYVLYGDGQGTFSRAVLLPNPDPRITSRAPAVADFDQDGRLDVAFLAEIDYDLSNNTKFGGTSTTWIVFNKEKGWKSPRNQLTQGVIGDNLDAADVNGDSRPDLILSSNSTNFRKMILLNQGEGGWQVMPYHGILSNALHTEIIAPDVKGQPGEVFATFVQFLRRNDTNMALTGLVRYEVPGEGEPVQGQILVSDDQRFNPYFRLGVGDLNGDGLLDIAAGRKGGQLELYLQTEDGLFYKEVSPELDTIFGTPYDIQLVDIDGDGFDDVIAMFAQKDDRPGGVRIWMSRPRV